MNFFEVIKYIIKTKKEHFLFFNISTYEKYKWLITILILFNKSYRKCNFFRKEYKHYKNIVVVGLKYYGRNVRRRTNGFAKLFLKENPEENCPYCEKELNIKNITSDHIIVVSKGGNNSKINLLPCCKSCNEERGDLDFYKYLYIKQPKYKRKKYPFI